jgi:hypothetical protein
MRYITLNHITNSYLSQTRKPRHYYYRFLKYAADSFRELTFDTLKVINSTRIPVDQSTKSAKVPPDFIDWVKVGVQVGQFVRPLIKKNSINRLVNYSESGEKSAYGNPILSDDFVAAVGWIGNRVNDNGENTGGFYGAGAGSEPDTFDFIRERGEIQLNENFTKDFIYLDYLSDGTSLNSATQIDPYAQKTIEKYIDWQFKENSKSFGAYDAERAKQQFYNELRILRGRLDDLKPETVERIINRSRKATLK